MHAMQPVSPALKHSPRLLLPCSKVTCALATAGRSRACDTDWILVGQVQMLRHHNVSDVLEGEVHHELELVSACPHLNLWTGPDLAGMKQAVNNSLQLSGVCHREAQLGYLLQACVASASPDMHAARSAAVPVWVQRCRNMRLHEQSSWAAL